MGFLDALLGRSKSAAPDLDHLFGLSGARITLEASEGLVPTGRAGVCFKPAAGTDFAATHKEVIELLQLGKSEDGSEPDLSETEDDFGYHWIILSSPDFDDLVTRAHIANATLLEHGYGPQLLCSAFGFVPTGTPPPATVYLVYLYKRGTFYPFVPTGPERRDNEAELRLKAELSDDLVIESELDRWFPLWQLPVH